MKLILLHVCLAFLTHYPCIATNGSNQNATPKINQLNNFCSRQELVSTGEISLENALEGMNITASLTGEDLPVKNIWRVVMDEVAHRGGFNVIYDATGGVDANETWTDKLVSELETHDIAVDWWTRTLDRLTKGIIYQEAWWDADTIMVVQSVKDQNKVDYFAFFEVFSGGLWILILFVSLFNGVVYCLLDYLRSHRQLDKELETDIKRSMFLSVNGFVGHSDFDPKASSARLLTISMNFLYLILIAAYTANLANFLIAKNSFQLEIDDISEVLKPQKMICVERGTGPVDSFKVKYPGAKHLLLEYNSPTEMYAGLNNRDCSVILTSLEGWNTDRRDDQLNIKCSMEWIGRSVETMPASFAVLSSSERCTSLLNDVVDWHLIYMKADGVVADIWKTWRDNSLSNTCSSTLQESESSAKIKNLTIANMAGLFILHACVVLFTIITEVILFCRTPGDRKALVKEDMIKIAKTISKTSVANTVRRFSGSLIQTKLERNEELGVCSNHNPNPSEEKNRQMKLHIDKLENDLNMLKNHILDDGHHDADVIGS